MTRFWILPLLLTTSCSEPRTPTLIQSFSTSKTRIREGETVTLSWSATPAKATCTLGPDTEPVAASGERTIALQDSTSFTLDCGASRAIRAVTVDHDVLITAFTATPSTVMEDEIVTFAWTTQHAEHCSIDPLVGSVDIGNGTVTTPIAESETLTLTCSNAISEATAHVTVTTTPAVPSRPPTNIVVVPNDGFLTVSWDDTRFPANLYVSEHTGVTPTNATLTVTRVRPPFRLTGLINGVTYFLRLSNLGQTAESPLSDEVTGTPARGDESADPFFPLQWHLLNTGQKGGTAGVDINVTPAWLTTRGEGIRAVVVDDGIDLEHADLFANIVPQASHDYLELEGGAPLEDAYHGTAVAGLIGARDLNGTGGRGVAPRVRLLTYNVLEDLTSANELDAMTRGAQLNAVMNNSWGDADDGTGLLTSADPLWLQGVREGATLGRQGKGVVYIWAAGNGGQPPYVDNANYDQQANSRFVISIGGTDDDGVKASYSEAGASVLAVTLSGDGSQHDLTTTDITGDLGFNDGRNFFDYFDANYTAWMDGTSAAAPVATGVVALILQVRPDLTYRDVRRVLAMSARKTDPTDADWTTNAAGLHINHKYGFGMIDATQALTVAASFVAQAPERSWTSPLRSINASVPTAPGATDTITATSTIVGHVEVVEVTVDAKHDIAGDMDIWLEHNGTTSVLHEKHTCEPSRRGTPRCVDIEGHIFTTVRHLDEPGDGDWTLRFRDTVQRRTGVLTSWKLSIYGRP